MYTGIDVIELASALLVLIAVYQLVDDTQAVMIGSLRGYKDTTMPMVFSPSGILGTGPTLGILLATVSPARLWVFTAIGSTSLPGLAVVNRISLLFGCAISAAMRKELEECLNKAPQERQAGVCARALPVSLQRRHVNLLIEPAQPLASATSSLLAEKWKPLFNSGSLRNVFVQRKIQVFFATALCPAWGIDA